MPIDPKRVQAVFLVAVEQTDPAGRAAVLDRECGADAELRQRVEALLHAHDAPGSLLDGPAAAAAQTVDEVPAHQAEAVGAIVAGRYKLLQQIGEGGMGSVFMAEQMRPVKRMVAFKVIKAGMDSKQVLARFESERQALALMDHPNIARVLDAGTTERGHPFFAMELVKGVPLTQFCDERQLSVGDRLIIFQQICRAVQHAHQKGVIHRDLKPTNILVESHDGKPAPKVIDFGLAKAVSALPLTDRSLFTHFGAVLGTPLYMAPEQAEYSAIDVDTRADVYALGVILYELLTGTTPVEKKRFAKAAWDEIRRVLKEEEPQKPSARLSTTESRASIAAQRQSEPNKLGKFVRGDLDWIVMKALAKERDRRYDTANALAADVERFLNDEPVLAGPPTVAYKLRKFVRRHRGQVVAVAVLLFALVAGAAVSTWQAVRATHAEEAAKDALTVAERNRREADEQRKKAETQAASIAVDVDLKYCEDGEVPHGLLRLAQTLPTIPEHAQELRECVALNILAWGQKLCPAMQMAFQNYDVAATAYSPDGRTIMTSDQDGTVRLWDALSGKERAILGESRPATMGNHIQFSGDGRTAVIIRDNFYRNWSQIDNLVRRDDRIVELWDVDAGRFRVKTAQHPGAIVNAQLSDNGSLLVTACSLSDKGWNGAGKLFLWNAQNGQLLRTVDVTGSYSSCAVSPDGRSVLVAQKEEAEVWSLEEGSPPKRLLGDNANSNTILAAFSPSGRYAVTVSQHAVRWWNTDDWRLQQETAGVDFPFNETTQDDPSGFVREDIVQLRKWAAIEVLGGNGVVVRNQPKPIVGKSRNRVRVSPNGALVAFDVNDIYDTRDGQRLSLPAGRKFHPELSQFAEDGRYAIFPPDFVADLATEKKIGFNSDSRFLTKQNASINADLLQKWCRVVTRGQLDQGGRYSEIDESTWENQRQELARDLDANPNASVLRPAAADRLYWLREEIKQSKSPLPLYDRLIAAEPTWLNYRGRAQAQFDAEHWDLAARDELEAARLRGDRYWRDGNPYGNIWGLGNRLVYAPGRPREQYELALRWAEAKSRAGVIEPGKPGQAGREPSRQIISLAQFRLGRYSDALATLRQSDGAQLSQVAGALMSPWNLLTITEFTFDPMDRAMRAMCYHHLGQPKEAETFLRTARELMGQEDVLGDEERALHRSLLREAELLIEGKGKP